MIARTGTNGYNHSTQDGDSVIAYAQNNIYGTSCALNITSWTSGFDGIRLTPNDTTVNTDLIVNGDITLPVPSSSIVTSWLNLPIAYSGYNIQNLNSNISGISTQFSIYTIGNLTSISWSSFYSSSISTETSISFSTSLNALAMPYLSNTLNYAFIYNVGIGTINYAGTVTIQLLTVNTITISFTPTYPNANIAPSAVILASSLTYQNNNNVFP